MTTEKQPLLTRFKSLLEKVKQARSTANPFKAKALKDEIEPQIEPMALEAVQLLHELTSRCENLQNEIQFLDSRLSQLGG
jgi:hypothetical protein